MPPVAQSVIRENYEHSEDKKLYQYILDAIAGKLSKKSYHKLSNSISDRMANDIERIVGFSVKGYGNEISPDHIQHIEDRHGVNGEADHSMQNLHDVAKMGYVINTYDRMVEGDLNYEYKNSDGSPSKTVVIQKKIDNGYYYVVEAVPDAKRKTLHVVSAYINKNDTFPEVGVSKTLNPNARNEPQSNVSSYDDRIPQSAEDVTKNIKNDDMNCNTQNAKIASITEKTLFVGRKTRMILQKGRIYIWMHDGVSYFVRKYEFFFVPV